MPVKFLIKDEEVDIPRGLQLPSTGEVILIKMKGKLKTYVVDSVTHKLDYDIAITSGITHIRLEEIEESKPKSKKKELKS